MRYRVYFEFSFLAINARTAANYTRDSTAYPEFIIVIRAMSINPDESHALHARVIEADGYHAVCEERKKINIRISLI